MVNTGAPLFGLAQQFLIQFHLTTGSRFTGGEGNDVFDIASEVTTAIGGTGNDTFLVNLDVVSVVSLSDEMARRGSGDTSPDFTEDQLALIEAKGDRKATCPR